MTPPVIGLLIIDDEQAPPQHIITSLNLPLLDSTTQLESLAIGQFVLVLDEKGLSLAYTGRKQPGNIRVDFVSGSANHRRQFGGGKSQMIAKAIGLKGSYKPTVLDLTAGLGQDGFVLACLGCTMSLVERSPIVHALLNDGLQRGLRQLDDNELSSVLQRMALHHANSIDFLDALSEPVDVIYLDPMFPSRDKSAKVKKEMQAFHEIVGQDDDAGVLLGKALNRAKYRVVVKRPRIAPALHEQYPDCSLSAPSLALTGKTSRYDIYTIAKMPTA